MRQETAEEIALGALGWLAGRENLLEAFLNVSGAEASQIRSIARETGFQTALLDFILTQDAWVIDCAQDLGYRPDELVAARAVLGGGDQMHWT
ncbi:DUF3572 domain-containing protein [Thioclava sp. GXIMD4216]|uniref:DUF3572 domain-containing protein n=1 Tax=Thioclava litoralis TaxID=3076557 RepID=A0ABZ1DYU7_9RHOB|nr:DUF3572 domain-containing protein [Thioclava sp. FTW29]